MATLEAQIPSTSDPTANVHMYGVVSPYGSGNDVKFTEIGLFKLLTKLQVELDLNNFDIISASGQDIDLHSDNDVNVILGDASGVDDFNIRDSASVKVFGVDSDGNVTLSGTLDGRDIAADGTTLDANVVIGTHQIFIPALAMYPATTNPCSNHTKSELATNDVDIYTLDFAGATANEIAKFDWIPPENWDNGTIKVKLYWTGAAGAGTVKWDVNAIAIGNDDALDAAFGTAISVTDTFITANDMHVTDQTTAITIGGTPAAADWVQIKIVRDQATDTKAEDAKLIGMVLEYTIDEALSAG